MSSPKIKLLIHRNKPSLLGDIQSLIENARAHVAHAVNSGLVMLYWNIGKRIREDILKDKRADYGKTIVSTLSKQLTKEYGDGYTEKNVFKMLQFFETFTDPQIVVTLSRQLGWSHFVALLAIENELSRNFYAEMCRIERWSVRILGDKIGGMLFERTALSKKPEKLAKEELSKLRIESRLTPDLVFRDPYHLDFLHLKNTYHEKDLESAILREMEAFILELGVGFSFVGRQKRISVGPDDFYLDLLFYHRKLRRLVAIELKLEKFKPEFKGQMELYGGVCFCGLSQYAWNAQVATQNGGSS